MALLIAIVGGSGSGKSTLAHALRDRLPGGAVTLVSEDAYYGDWGANAAFDPMAFDFDDVAARDHDLLADHLAALKAGESVEGPVYSFVTHRRQPGGQTLSAAPLIVVEGAHLLCSQRLIDLFDLKVFIHTPPDVRFIRRLLRDQHERGRTVASVVGQYLATVRPAHLRLIEPSRSDADLVIDDDTAALVPDNPAEIDRLIEPVLQHPMVKAALA
jgi:uridine kinase